LQSWFGFGICGVGRVAVQVCGDKTQKQRRSPYHFVVPFPTVTSPFPLWLRCDKFRSSRDSLSDGQRASRVLLLHTYHFAGSEQKLPQAPNQHIGTALCRSRQFLRRLLFERLQTINRTVKAMAFPLPLSVSSARKQHVVLTGFLLLPFLWSAILFERMPDLR
jgi:hypothetical protein